MPLSFKQDSRRAILGTLVAIAITATMDAVGLSAFSALPLLPLVLLFCFLGRISRRRAGFVLGRPRHYVVAALQPTLVLAALALVATLAGAVRTAEIDWRKAVLNGLLMAAVTVLVAVLTEEGFFRGWLWASLEDAGYGKGAVVVGTSVAFGLWHLSAATLETGFELPAAQVPVFLLNATLLGAAWGLIRWASGSVVAASVSHGLWNGATYTLFGFGTREGALGIANTSLYGPEVGLLGLLFNALAVAVLWRWSRRSSIEGGERQGLWAARSDPAAGGRPR